MLGLIVLARLFVGISLPPDVVQDAALTLSGIRGARWVAPHNLHINSAYFGEVDFQQCDRIIEALDELDSPCFTTRIQGCGVFPHRGAPRQLWFGVDAPSPFADLRQAALSPLRGLIRPTDDRKYHPHVKIAGFGRCSTTHMRRWIESHAFYRSEAFRVEKLSLYLSERDSGSVSYTELARFRLSAPSQEEQYRHDLRDPCSHF